MYVLLTAVCGITGLLLLFSGHAAGLLLAAVLLAVAVLSALVVREGASKVGSGR